jgi:hypothetical protein
MWGLTRAYAFQSFRKWLFLLTVSVGVSSGVASSSRDKSDRGHVGENFFEVLGRPIVYDFWGPIVGFRSNIEAFDDKGYLAKNSPPESLLDTDLFIFALKDWGGIRDIPYRYSELAQIFENTDIEAGGTVQSFDVGINYGGAKRPLRVYLINLSNLGSYYEVEECIVPYIYASSIFRSEDIPLIAGDCKKEAK